MSDTPEDALRQGLQACGNYWDTVKDENERLRANLDTATSALDEICQHARDIESIYIHLIAKGVLKTIRGES